MLERLLDAKRIVHRHNRTRSFGRGKYDREARFQKIANILRLFLCQLVGNDNQSIGIPGTDWHEVNIGPRHRPETAVLRVVTSRAEAATQQKIAPMLIRGSTETLN